MASILKNYHPQAFTVLKEMNNVIMQEGALSVKTKELMAVALSIAAGCEPCVKIHTRRALEQGAGPEELAETIGVAVLLLGGPADVWPTRIIEEEIEHRHKNA